MGEVPLHGMLHKCQAHHVVRASGGEWSCVIDLSPSRLGGSLSLSRLVVDLSLVHCKARKRDCLRGRMELRD